MLGTVLHVLMKMIYEEDENDFVKNFWLITDKWNLIGTMIVLAWYVVRTSLSKVRWDKMIIRWHSGHFLHVLYTQFYMKWQCLSELNSTKDLKSSKRLFLSLPAFKRNCCVHNFFIKSLLKMGSWKDNGQSQIVAVMCKVK